MSKKKPYVEGLEELILGSVMKSGGNAYAIPIWKDLETGGRDVAIGMIYVHLDRLEASGFVRSRVGEATAVRGGRKKKYYDITGEGIEALLESKRVREHVLPVLNPLGLGAMV
jgi:PadR family transcriptional regulator, regulatory protein PadR